MVDLIAKSVMERVLPIRIGNNSLSEVSPEAITWVAPAPGREKAVSDAIKTGFGAGFPRPNRATGKEGARFVWFGDEQALFIGAPVIGIKDAALVDQSDGWVILRLEGAGAEAVLARRVPVDLRLVAFKRGHAVRSLLGDISAVILRTGNTSFDILVFRSMARTAVAELTRAMEIVAARGG